MTSNSVVDRARPDYAEDYRRAGFGSGLGWGRKPALVMIDMMNAYFTDGSPLQLPDSTVADKAVELLESARSAGLLIVHTRVRYSRSLLDGGVFVRKIPALRILAEGQDNHLAAFLPGCEPVGTEIEIVKKYASAFHGTELASTLTAHGVDTVVVAGVSTSGCVRASATDAIQRGFAPLVVSDACGDRNPEVHNANLFDLGAKYADIVDTASVSLHLRSAFSEHRT